MLRAAMRLGLLGLAALATGCSSLESLESMFADAPFVAKPVASSAAAPVFRVGDVYRFRVGDTLVSETVENIDGQGVWWQDSLGRRWIGGAKTLIPTRAVVQTGNEPRIVNTVMEATGNIFPLTQGKTVAYRYTVQDGFHAAQTHEQSCTVAGFGAVTVAAGVFDAFRLECNYDGLVRQNYYAPAIGRVVLQTSNTIFDSVKRELVGFERGPDEPLRMAKAQPAAPTPAMITPAARPQPQPAVQAPSGMRYGVQLAAYRSPTRARQAWDRLKRVGGGLLDGHAPAIERHDSAKGPLFRLIVGDYETKNKARSYCRTLKRSGIDCWPRARIAAPRHAATAPPASDMRVVRR